jgi:hypothetical protein
MAKKKETKKVNVAPEVKATNEMTQVVVEKPKAKKTDNWEIKDRYYYLAGNREPLAYVLKSSGLFWFDEEKGYEREIKYTRNQQTVFVDEFKGEAINEHIIFRDGVLSVPRRFQNLQKFLSLYHPAKGVVYLERDEVKEAVNELDYIELEIEALNLANGLEIDMAEAIMRAEIGSRAGKMSSKELKRDLLLFARRNPSLFIELANDENVHLRNIGIKATESRIISLSQDQRTFTWGSTGRKLMTVPFDEHPYSALAAWFKTDEGMEVFSSIEKRLK